MVDFSGRHKNLLGAIDEHYNQIKKYIPKDTHISDTKRSLLGAYFSLEKNADGLAEALRQRIDTIEKREYEQRVFTDYESYFQIFVGIALALLLLEFMLSYRTSSLRKLRSSKTDG